MALSSHLQIIMNELYVHDLEQMVLFYTKVMKFDIVSQSEDEVVLGCDKIGLLKLIAAPMHVKSNPNSAGLYHIAYVFDTRGGLANRIKHILSDYSDYFQGSADHLVSEAFYFADPEGNGIELYYDKDPKTRKRMGDLVVMDSLFLDPGEYIHKYSDDDKPGKFHIGHVHLKVGNIDQAREFYHEIIGLDITAHMSSALFMSVGKYHHHVGMNTWESSGAGMRSDNELGLGKIFIKLGERHDIEALAERLKTFGKEYIIGSDGELELSDPWGNRLVFG